METLNTFEASELLKCSENYIRELAESGELRGAKIGKGWIFLRSDVLDYVRHQVDTQHDRRVKEAKTDEMLELAAQRTGRTVLTRQQRRKLRKPPLLPELPGKVGTA